MAVEDAFVLSALLSDSRITSRKELLAALATYDKVRRPRTQRSVQYSRDNGCLYQMRLPGVLDDVEKIAAAVEKRQRWIWDIDLDAHLEEALMMLGTELWE